MQAVFATRDVILRSDGRIRYLRLTARTQVVSVVALTVIGFSAITASIGMSVQQLSIRGHDIEVRNADDAYTRLLTEVTGYFDQFSKSANVAVADETYLLGLSDDESAARRRLAGGTASGDFWTLTAASPEEQQALREKLRLALRDKLASFDTDLQRIAARNQSLSKQLVDVQHKNTALTDERDSVTEDRDRLAREVAAQHNENLALNSRLAQLTETRSRLDAELAAEAEKQDALNRQLADLQRQLEETKVANLDLTRQVAQNQRALSTVIAQRNLVQTDRTDMAGTIEDLKQRLSTLQESQASFVSHLTERTRQNLSDMEKTVQMTGLKVDDLLRLTSEPGMGQGGPFIPAPTDTKDLNEKKLLESVATLDDEVGRWEKLQVILRSLPLSTPVDRYYISSGFGERTDPLNGEAAIHEGLDMVDSIKSDVMATAPGRVIFAGWRGSYGRVVEIDHGLGIMTVYAHLDSVLVKVGDLVDYRQTIGKLGNSGRSSGAHVHYEVRFEGKPLDPMGFLKAGRYVFKG
ncbi:peptidoglycan DD-metalloendopeptidase family protein [Dongia sp.]|uniref:peptidoglycan DD-metalloendopeptidase family protein n=1 Tax=Dongia sp. TaxID=1977262 RepID=UPI0037527E19